NLSFSAFLQPFSPVAPGLFRPVTILSYVLDAGIGGMQPWIFHASNILLHAVASILVFLLTRKLLQQDIPALAASLLFAVHPVHTEAVTWVSGRSELLAAMFVLVGVLFHLQSVGARHALPLQLGSALAYFLALSSKEIAVSLPFVLALLPFIHSRISQKDRTNSILLLLFVFIALSIYLLLRVGALGSLTIPLAHTRTAGLPTLDRLLLMPPVIARYILLMVFPWGLRLEYDWSSFPFLITAGSILLMILLLGLGWWLFRRGERVAAFGIAWFFFFLLPVANIIPIGELIAERFLYLPSVGFCILVGALFSSTEPRNRGANGEVMEFVSRLRSSKTVLIIMGTILLVFSSLTIRRNLDWRDPEILWRKTLALSPEAPHARENLIVMLLARGDLKEAGSLLAEELPRFPEKPMLHFLAGQLFRRTREDERAKKHFELALELGKPGNVEFTDFQRASVLLELWRFAEALPLLEHAASENPFDPSLLNNLGVAQAQLGKFPEAILSFERAIALYEEQGSLSEEDQRNLAGARGNLEMLRGVQ
ncbi:MAG: tetratricopeptide repeat protein, partial [Patescibacteria group bacterium]